MKQRFGVSTVWLAGVCPSCGEPNTGEYHVDDHEFVMECVSCHKKYQYKTYADDCECVDVDYYSLREIE